MRAVVMAKYDGIDLWALYHHHRLEYAETVHHITTTADDGNLFFSVDNLIPVSRQSHDEIHALYKTDKEGTQAMLRAILAEVKRSGVGGI